MRSLSTGEVAKITKTSVQSVIRWIDTGMLNAWKIPGSRFRRIEVSELRAFMLQHHIPLGYLETEVKRVLVVSHDDTMFSILQSCAPNGLPVICASPFEAGMRLVDSLVALVVIDESLGEPMVKGILESLASRANEVRAITFAFETPSLQNEDGSRDSRDRLRELFSQQVEEALRSRP
ncbi:MAG: hypothetical protein RL518_2677 [Pseudomonadota bacterium]|jgi:excisionase family DNA binding protein